MKIKVNKDVYEEGYNVFTKKELEVKEGITILVGCNGTGKTSLMNEIEAFCNKNHHPCLHYDNLTNGGQGSIGDLIYRGNVSNALDLMSSSEGECILLNIQNFCDKIIKFLQKDYLKWDDNPFSSLLKERRDEKLASLDNHFFILLDAIDSGLSVDGVVELKKYLFTPIVEKIKEKSDDSHIYVLITANEYEMAREMDCLDVSTFRYLRFVDYEDYRKFILQSRKKKQQRYIRWQKKMKRGKEKEEARKQKEKEESDTMGEKRKYEWKKSRK